MQRLIATATAVAAMASPAAAVATPAEGIHNIQHVVANDLNFNQTPRAALILNPHPAPGPPSKPPG